MHYGSGLLILIGVIALALVFTRVGRALAGLAILIVLAVAAWRIFVRSSVCNEDGCRIALQPTWAGPCLPSPGGIEKIDGRYYLTGAQGARAYCLDARFWQ